MLQISCSTPDRKDWTRTIARMLTTGSQCPRNALSHEELALNGEVDQEFGHIWLEVAVVLNDCRIIK